MSEITSDVRDRNTGRQSGRKFLFESSEWDFDTMQRVYDAIAEVALEDLGLDIYPNQIEIITSEQMLDAYASHGMPLIYRHWSFGKHFVREERRYRHGFAGLAYEIVINSNPCISYNMEENTMPMQTLVMAHAAFGHNHFFKNNYLFRQWTDAAAILDYLKFARDFITECEEKHGVAAVEETLDSAHALMDQGVFRYERQPQQSARAREEREQARVEYEDRTFNDLWRTVHNAAVGEDADESELAADERKKRLNLPEENLLYFLEKQSPVLEPWQREILRIVRRVAQYFYPQKQTKVMNEGCATFVHHHIIHALHERGLITDGALLEMLHSHSSVLRQPDFDDPHFGGINPYALGFAMMTEIKRICSKPEEEDRQWFPDIAGNGDWRGTLRNAWANYRDESFIRQFLSPRLIREWRLFQLCDGADEQHYTVGGIHDERGYRQVRETLARSYDIAVMEPEIQIVDVDLRGDRVLHLHHTVRDGVHLREEAADDVLAHLRRLWGYDVCLTGIDAETEATAYHLSTARASESSDA